MRMALRNMVTRMFSSEQNHKLVAGPADASGSNSKDGVAGAGVVEQETNAVLYGTNVMGVLVAGFADCGGQGFAGDAGYGRFTGSVDIGYDQDIGLIERARELFPKMLRAGIPVRLEKNQQAVEFAAAGSLEGRFDFGRVMAVVVDHCNVVDRTFDIETAADSAKVGESLPDKIDRNVEIERDGSGSSGIAYVVNAGRMREVE